VTPPAFPVGVGFPTWCVALFWRTFYSYTAPTVYLHTPSYIPHAPWTLDYGLRYTPPGSAGLPTVACGWLFNVRLLHLPFCLTAIPMPPTRFEFTTPGRLIHTHTHRPLPVTLPRLQLVDWRPTRLPAYATVPTTSLHCPPHLPRRFTFPATR